MADPAVRDMAYAIGIAVLSRRKVPAGFPAGSVTANTGDVGGEKEKGRTVSDPSLELPVPRRLRYVRGFTRRFECTS